VINTLPDFAGMTHEERYEWMAANGHNVWLWRDDVSGLWAYCRCVTINAEVDAHRAAAIDRLTGAPEKVASHVAVDTRDGMVIWAGSDGALFTRATAVAFVWRRNAEMKVPSYRVFALTEEAGCSS
jgi:hypothetical protein